MLGSGWTGLSTAGSVAGETEAQRGAMGAGVLCPPIRADPDISAPCQELPGEPGSLLRLDNRGLLRLPGAQSQVTLPGLGDTGRDSGVPREHRLL